QSYITQCGNQKEMKDENGDRFTCEKLEMLMGRWGLIPRILKKWKDELYGETEFDKLINEVELVKCLRSVNEEGMSKDSASGRLIHIIVEPDFRKYKFNVVNIRSNKKKLI
ncbi:4107_t:CDS:2, partial [Funneliformis mosseae]